MRIPTQLASPPDPRAGVTANTGPGGVDPSIFGIKVPVLDDIISVAKPIACTACAVMPPGPAKIACMAACALV